MAFNPKELPAQLKTLLKHISIGKLIALLVFLFGSLAAFIFLITWSGKDNYLPLYTQMAPADAGEVMAALDARKIPYRLSANGTTVMVPRDKIYTTRIDLATQGLPNGGGIGFELFDNLKLGMTEFAQTVNYQRALQGELVRTINGLSEVESSRVHLVMPEKSLFIEDESPASASVILKLKGGRFLTKDQVQGIVNLVSSSVSQLPPEKVTVVDSNGKLLAGHEDPNDLGSISNDQLDFQARVERGIETRVTTMLENVLGEEKAIVRVAAELDFIRQEKTEELYLPENQVVRSAQNYNETSNRATNGPAGIPGLAANITQGQGGGATGTTTDGFRKTDNTTNYEIGKVTSHQIMPTGKLKRLSVAVVVDGSYETTPAGGDGEGGAPTVTYVPRTDDEMAKLQNIVKRAVNFNKERGDQVEVVNISFAAGPNESAVSDASPGFLDGLSKYAFLLKYLIAGGFLIFSYLVVVKPLIAWLTSTSVEDYELIEQLPKTIAELEKQYDGTPLPYTQQAAQLISNNQDGTAQLMQNWLKEK
jgi:flagellar M-ring protein FliF